MKVNIIITKPDRTGEFALIKLSFKDIEGTEKIVSMRISFQSLNDFSNDTTSIAFDFFFISSLVYGIDNLLERYQYSIDGWARDIEVCFPVNNLQVWNDNKTDFNSLLAFLTGDYWNVSFEQINNISFFTNKAKRWKSKVPSYTLDDYNFASLFSGGLDSLVGVIDGLNNLEKDKKGLLLSHFDSSSPGANSDQVRINQYFAQNNQIKNKYNWIQSVVALSNQDTHGNELSKESSFRSRSLLFIGIALFCIEKLPNCNLLTIPENGTISLNYPLTPSRTSTLSTRTTHPYYIELLQKFIYDIGLNTQLDNPYKKLTKGELIANCSDFTTLSDTYAMSVSCGKRGRKMHWHTKAGTHHCGRCMPCIYRRAGLHKLNLDNQLYGIDIFTTPNEIFDKFDFPALFDFLNRRNIISGN
jgi:7-cyano-7-deazaguanine synthase in queuosine biosynthesis